METDFHCPKCQCPHTVKNGHARGKPRKKCRECSYQFTIGGKKGFSPQAKIGASLIYMSGVSIGRTAFLLNASHSSVQRWIEEFGKAFGERPKPPPTEGKAKMKVVVGIDKMWRFIEKKSKTMDLESL